MAATAAAMAAAAWVKGRARGRTEATAADEPAAAAVAEAMVAATATATVAARAGETVAGTATVMIRAAMAAAVCTEAAAEGMKGAQVEQATTVAMASARSRVGEGQAL